MNGPMPRAAAHVAMPDASSAAGAAPRCWNRHAAHPMNGSTTNINGAFVSNETVWSETNGYYEVYIGTQTGSANFHYSKQALDMMKTIRAFHTVYGWRNF